MYLVLVPAGPVSFCLVPGFYFKNYLADSRFYYKVSIADPVYQTSSVLCGNVLLPHGPHVYSKTRLDKARTNYNCPSHLGLIRRHPNFQKATTPTHLSKSPTNDNI